MIYLPIAEMSLNILLLLMLGGVIGVLSGIFGVGGGFLMTPFLIFFGVPSPVAVASGLNQILASSLAAFIPHQQRGNVDYMMAGFLLFGGIFGSVAGISLFNYMKIIGQIDLFVKLSYIIFLSIIGGLMVVESLKSIRYAKQKKAGNLKLPPRRKFGTRLITHGMPHRMRFRKSNLYISIYPPIIAGFLVGVLTAIMGVGGGFIMIPIMIYILGMPASMVIGTSLFQIIFVAAFSTMMQAVFNQTVDLVLSLTLIIGGVIGAQIGSHYGQKFRGEQLRLLFALMITALGLALFITLIWPPDDIYEINVRNTPKLDGS
ncbi:MAG: sulfite exporter TauE/SafE family protein [Alphaproteobacteria bacterium]